jgi:hypothetical protein
MQASNVKTSLQAALDAVSFRNTLMPLFFESSGYKPLSERISGVHVVAKESGVDVYEYTTDIRESGLTKTSYDTIEDFVRGFVSRLIDHAATVHMATVERSSLEKLKSGQHAEFFEKRKQFVDTLSRRLDDHLDRKNLDVTRSADSKSEDGGAIRPKVGSNLQFMYSTRINARVVYILLTPLVVGGFIYLLFSMNMSIAFMALLFFVSAIRFVVRLSTKPSISLVTLSAEAARIPTGLGRDITLTYLEISNLRVSTTASLSILTITSRRGTFNIRARGFEDVGDFRFLVEELERRVALAQGHQLDPSARRPIVVPATGAGDMTDGSQGRRWPTASTELSRSELKRFRRTNNYQLLSRKSVLLPTLTGLSLIAIFSTWIYAYMSGIISFDEFLSRRYTRGQNYQLIIVIWLVSLACLLGGIAMLRVAFFSWKENRDKLGN